MIAALYILLALFFAPVNTLAVLDEYPSAQCDLVRVDGIGDHVGVGIPYCTQNVFYVGRATDAHTIIGVYVNWSRID